jgi:1-acyl-sn-glycerol-3-phosphate acyltransferase
MAQGASTRPGDVLRSLAFYAVFYGGTAVIVVVAILALILAPRRFRPVADSWSSYHRFCLRHLLGIRVETQGVLPQGKVLVAGKHESFFEAIDVPNFVVDPAAFAKVELSRIPLWSRASTAYGNISVEREEGAKALRAMIVAARQRIAEGRALVIFPEGSRVPHGARPPLQSGFAGLYKMLSLPVVPVAVNSGPLYHRRWKRSGVITIRIGEPIPAGLPREEIEARVLAAINVLNSEDLR